MSSEESITGLMNDYEAAVSAEGFYRKSFFTSKNNIQEPASKNLSEAAKKAQDSGSELDRAFNYLEHIASRGFNPIEPRASQKQKDGDPDSRLSDPKETPSEKAEEPIAPVPQEPTVEDRQMMREVWRCFSTDQQELGVQLYRKLVEKPNCVAAVKEELEKLVILFPDNTEVADLFNSIQG